MSRATLEHTHAHTPARATLPRGRRRNLAVHAWTDGQCEPTLNEAKVMVLAPLLLKHLDGLIEEHDAAIGGHCSCHVCQPLAAMRYTVEMLFGTLEGLLSAQERMLRVAKRQLIAQQRQSQQEAKKGDWENSPEEDAMLTSLEELEASLTAVRESHDAEEGATCNCEICSDVRGARYAVELLHGALRSHLMASPAGRLEYEQHLMVEVRRIRVQRAEEEASVVAVSVEAAL